MSSLRITTVGVMTREQAKASAQLMASIDELAKKVDNLSKRRRNNSKQAGPAKEATPESKAAATSPPGSDHGEDADLINVQVWNEMFEDKPFYDIAGDSDFLKNKVCGLISPEQVK